jgi:hypothetical protein
MFSLPLAMTIPCLVAGFAAVVALLLVGVYEGFGPCLRSPVRGRLAA